MVSPMVAKVCGYVGVNGLLVAAGVIIDRKAAWILLVLSMFLLSIAFARFVKERRGRGDDRLETKPPATPLPPAQWEASEIEDFTVRKAQTKGAPLVRADRLRKISAEDLEHED